MSAEAITIKPNNHRVHPCPNGKKIELINKLISDNSSLEIIVVASVDVKGIQEALDNKDIKVMGDKEFITSKELTCEMLISFDVPQKAIIYSARVAKVTEKASLLLDKSEQKLLYPIEMLLGRAIKQEVISGFEYEVIEKKEPEYTGRKMTKTQIIDEAKKRHDKVNDEFREKKPKFDKPKRDYKDDKKKDFKSDRKSFDKSKRDDSKDNKWAKKDKAPNKFLGKDENGKAIFSGKSGDRNHRYDGTQRDKWDAPKKVGRKINIKALKKKED
ncbi:MAG: hypothetical protein U9P72_04330 [Campylobacterota bacterium]|nr:hypothetical protein [Campylobacterota bacterium]